MTPASVALAGPLRDALLAADFTYAAVAEMLGTEGLAALSRNETTPSARERYLHELAAMTAEGYLERG